MKIITSYVYPPIPMRAYDWCAIREDYEADCDENGYFSRCLMGHGATEEAAIADLLEREEEAS